ncbi:MAG: hypothetical protein H7221_04935 [Flavobacterium sp.]|nr:hypothetical protein [Flavobacterium sp.]
MKTTKILLALTLSVVFFSCSKQDKDDNVNFSPDEAQVNAKIDASNDDVSDIVEGQFDATVANPTSGKSTETAAVAATNLPACVNITRLPAPGTPITTGTLVTKTVDFGTTGCPMPNGNILKGKIIITFTFNPNATSHVINYEFVNFYHNAIKFDGNKTFTRTMTAATAASPSHPIVVMTMDMTATFPDGRVFARVGTRTREIIEGYSTPIFSDNVYKITGSWTTTRPNTTLQTSTITTPLIVKMECIAQNKPLIVTGVISFVRNNQTATLDYGNGVCDNLAVFTFNGISYNIVIGN